MPFRTFYLVSLLLMILLVLHSVGADFVWQWQGDQDGDWSPYPADTCLALQAARNGHGEAVMEVTVGRTRYKLDTTRMVQTNTRTGFERLMERRESGTRFWCLGS